MNKLLWGLHINLKEDYDQSVISISRYGARKSEIYFSEKFNYIFYSTIKQGASTTDSKWPTAVQTSENAKRIFNIREGP